MNVLSLFDGISAGRVALERAGIPVTNYFAAEIDKYAIKISEKNYPDIIRLGDVTKVFAKDLPKIDIVIGGSPCQGFSFAGKQLNFDDPRSALFFEFVRLVNECKPKYFFLENVVMKKEYQAVISQLLGVDPIKVNSALVSAQNRNRLYWTNIPFYDQPEDKGIVLKDIIEDIQEPKCGASRGRNIVDGVRKDVKGAKCKQRIEVRKDFKTNTLTSVSKDNLILSGYADLKGHDIIKRVYSTEGKSPTLTAICGGNQEPKIGVNIIGNIYPKKGQNGIIHDIDGKSKTLSAGIGVNGRGIGSNNSPKIAIKEEFFKSRPARIYEDKSPTLRKDRTGLEKTIDGITWRKLTPIECERLQTFPDNYTEGVSNSQRYKMLGNSWTVDVIVHFFKEIK